MVLLLLGWCLGAVLPTLVLGCLALVPLGLMDAPPNMDTLRGWHAKQIVKYFSFKVSFVEALPENKACIMVSSEVAVKLIRARSVNLCTRSPAGGPPSRRVSLRQYHHHDRRVALCVPHSIQVEQSQVMSCALTLQVFLRSLATP